MTDVDVASVGDPSSTKKVVDTDSSSESSQSGDAKGDVTKPLTRRENWFGPAGTPLRTLRKQETWIGAVYFAAGLTAATKVLLPVYLSDRGVGAVQVGLVVGLDDLGLISKIPAGIVSDKFDLFGKGHRRPWVFIALWATALLFALRGFLDLGEFQYGWFLFLVISDAITREFYDKPIDAYAVEVIHSNHVGRIQGIMGAARGLALLIGFGVATLLKDRGRYGWASVFFFNAIALVLASLPSFNVPRARAENHFQWRAFNQLRRPNVAAHALFMFIGSIPTNIMLTAAPLYLESQGVATTIYLALAAVFVGIGSVAAASVDRFRPRFKWALWSSLSAAAIGSLFFILATVTGIVQIMYLWAIMNGLATGATLAMNYALLMLEVQDHSISASFLAIFGTIGSSGSLVGGVISGYLIEAFGFTGTVISMLIFLAINVPVVHFVFKGTDYKTVPIEATDMLQAVQEEDVTAAIELEEGGNGGFAKQQAVAASTSSRKSSSAEDSEGSESSQTSEHEDSKSSSSAGGEEPAPAFEDLEDLSTASSTSRGDGEPRSTPKTVEATEA